MPAKEFKWMEYIKTLVPLLLLIGSLLAWGSHQMGKLADQESRLKQVEKAVDQQVLVLHKKLSTAEERINSFGINIPQIRKNTKDIEMIMNKLDQQRDILIELKTLLYHLIDPKKFQRRPTR